MDVRRWVPPLLWMGLISAMSSTVIQSRAFTRAVATRSPIPVSEEGFTSFWRSWWWLFVKGFHVLEFAILAWLLLRATRGRLLLAGTIAASCAALDELHQTLVPERGGLVSDVAIDCLGVLAAIVVWLAVAWRRRGSEVVGGTGFEPVTPSV